jgi:hypothetical protein
VAVMTGSVKKMQQNGFQTRGVTVSGTCLRGLDRGPRSRGGCKLKVRATLSPKALNVYVSPPIHYWPDKADLVCILTLKM